MKAHARSIADPKPIHFVSIGYATKHYDTVANALASIHDNNPVRKVTVKTEDRWGVSEVWAESMITGKPRFMGVISRR